MTQHNALSRALQDNPASLPSSLFGLPDQPANERVLFATDEQTGLKTILAVHSTARGPAFGHQTLLTLTEGQYFDPFKRGRALAGAGRSAPTGPSQFNEQVARETHLRTMQAQWPALLQSFGADAEIGSTSVNNLWSAVTFVMTLRATRSHYWGVAEVEEACRAQLDALPAYRSAVANVAARLATSYDMPEAARQINKCYAAFFLPFWWEHILLRGVLEPAEHKRIVDGLAPAPAPAPLPAPVYAPSPAHLGWAPPIAPFP